MRYFLPCLLLAMPFPAVELDLPAILIRVKEHSHILKSQVHKFRAAKESEKIKRAYYTPEIDILSFAAPMFRVDGTQNGTTYSRNINRDLSHWGAYFNFEAKLRMPLLTFGRLSGLSRSLRRVTRAEEQQVHKKLQDVYLLAHQAYYGYLLGVKVREMAEFVREALGQALGELKRKGRENTRDYTILEIKRLEILTKETETKSRINEALNSLAVFTGEPLESLAIKGELVFAKVLLPPFKKLEAALLAQNADLETLRNLIEAKKSEINFQKAQGYPILFLGADFNFSKTPVREDIDNPFLHDPYNQVTGGAAVGFSLPIDFAKRSASSGKAREEYLSLLETFQEARRLLRLKLRNLVTRWTSLEVQERSLGQAVKLLNDEVLRSLSLYIAGKLSAKEVGEIVSDFSRMKLEYYQLTYDYFLLDAELQNLTGRWKYNINIKKLDGV